MNITKEFFEKQLKKHDKVTVYSPENIPLNISKVFFVGRVSSNPILHWNLTWTAMTLLAIASTWG